MSIDAVNGFDPDADIMKGGVFDFVRSDRWSNERRHKHFGRVRDLRVEDAIGQTNDDRLNI